MNVERRPCVFVGITLLSATASFAQQVKADCIEAQMRKPTLFMGPPLSTLSASGLGISLWLRDNQPILGTKHATADAFSPQGHCCCVPVRRLIEVHNTRRKSVVND